MSLPQELKETLEWLKSHPPETIDDCISLLKLIHVYIETVKAFSRVMENVALKTNSS